MVFVGVSNNDTVEDGEKYVEQFHVPYAMAHAPRVWKLFDVPYQPVTIVIGPDGRIAGRLDGPVTYEALREVIEPLL